MEPQAGVAFLIVPQIRVMSMLTSSTNSALAHNHRLSDASRLTVVSGVPVAIKGHLVSP